MKSGVREIKSKTVDVAAAMRLLSRSSVLVGVPADKGARKDGEVTNAEIGYVQEHGSPEANIPARPFLRPGVRAAHEEIVAQLRDAGRQALRGDTGGVARALARAGLVAQNSVRAQFVDNDWPELADATLDKRPPAQRDDEGKIVKRGKSRRERGAVNPLIDTSQLRKSITFVVEQK
jgi:hypothetical protein